MQWNSPAAAALVALMVASAHAARVPAVARACEPNTVWQRDSCNNCICTADGEIACTNRVCPPEGNECTPGDTWMEDCNTCCCTPDGVADCSEMDCLARSSRVAPAEPSAPSCREEHKRRVCRPGHSFKRDCNTCICSPDGQIAACTLMACLSPGGDTFLVQPQSGR